LEVCDKDQADTSFRILLCVSRMAEDPYPHEFAVRHSRKEIFLTPKNPNYSKRHFVHIYLNDVPIPASIRPPLIFHHCAASRPIPKNIVDKNQNTFPVEAFGETSLKLLYLLFSMAA
jgi:hypothetical protein